MNISRDPKIFARSWKYLKKVVLIHLSGDIPKYAFPTLLKSLDEKVRVTVAKCLISGFRACGLYPLDRNEVLRKLPEYRSLDQSEVRSSLNDSLIELLKGVRGQKDADQKKRGKKLPKKVPNLKTIIPGRALEIQNDERMAIDNPFANIELTPIAPIRVKIVDGIGFIVSSQKQQQQQGIGEAEIVDEQPSRHLGKPTARSYLSHRMAGLPEPTTTFQVIPECARCGIKWEYMKEKNRWLSCELCHDMLHLQCTGIAYEDQWGEFPNFQCECCKELSGGV